MSTVYSKNKTIKKIVPIILLILLAVLLCIMVLLVGFVYSYKVIKTPNIKLGADAVECTKNNNYLGLSAVEIANTDEERAQGLMYRSKICENRGMLFIFPESKNLSFWMKNTQVSLDIIFIDENNVVDVIHKNTVPERIFPTYDSTKPVKYVLEATAGFSNRQNLKSGDKIDVDKLLEVAVDYGNM